MMNKVHRNTGLLLALASPLFLAACDDSSWESTGEDVPAVSTPEGSEVIDDSAAADDVMAVIHTADGAEVRFSEPTAGEIVIESRPGSGGEDPLAHLDLDALDATEVYEVLTGEAAPTALVAAQHRLDNHMETAEPEEAGGADELAAAARAQIASVASLTPDEFRALYCAGMPHCLLNETGDLHVERRARQVRGWIYADQGDVRLTIRRKRVGGWRQIQTLDVLEGQIGSFDSGSTTIRRQLKLEVKEAFGDVYHIAYRF